MKLGKTIKRYIGVIYASIFSFGLCLGVVAFKTKAIETRASFTGTFSVNSQTEELEYSPIDSYIVTKISMSNLVDNGSGNFDLDVAILGMEPTGGDAAERESGTLFFTDATWREEQGTGEYGVYFGILTGKCSEIDGGETEVSFRTYTSPEYASQGDCGWDYADDELSYWSEEYSVDHTTQSAITYDEYHDYTLTYQIYGNEFESAGNIILMETLYIHIRDAIYSPADEGVTEYFGTIYGRCDEIEEPAELILKALVEPQYAALNNYQDGFNYIQDDHTLVYFDSEHPRADYTLAQVTFTQYNCKATLNYAGTVNGGTDTQGAEIWNAVYDPNAETISGDLAVMDTTEWVYVSTNTQVLLQFEEETVQEYYQEGWNYSQTEGDFVYYYFNQTNGEYSFLEVSSYDEMFHTSNVDLTDQYAYITYSTQVPGENNATEATFHIYEADYEIISDGYQIWGKVDSVYEGKTYTIPVNFVVSQLSFTPMKYQEYVYDSTNYCLNYWYDDFTPCETEITKVVFNNYGDTPNDAIKYNTVYITYKATDPQTGEVKAPSDTFCMYNAQVTIDNDTYCEGELLGDNKIIALPGIDVTNTIENGFNYIRGLDTEELIYFDATNRVPYEVAVTSIIYNVNGGTITVNSNRIHLETHESAENDPLTLEFVEITQEQTSQQNGIVKAFFKGYEITLTTPILTRVNDGPSGWQYNEGTLLWYSKDYDQTLEPIFAYASLNEDTNVMMVVYTIPYELITQREEDNVVETIHVTLTEPIEKDEMLDVPEYIITGTCSEIGNGSEVTLRISGNYITGWSYNSDGLFWYDSEIGTYVDTKCSSATYNAFISYSTITYTLQYADIPDSDTPNRDETIHIKNSKVNTANFGDTEVEYTVTGYCIELDQTVELTIEEPPGVTTDNTTGWQYDVTSGLTWHDASFGRIGWNSTYANINEDKHEATISFELLYSTATVGVIDNQTCDPLTITNASYETKTTGDGKIYTVLGECSALGGNISVDVSYLEIMRTGWNYMNSDDMYTELYWTEVDGDSLNYDIFSELTSAVYDKETSTVKFTYGIFSYERTGDGNPGGETQDETKTLIEEKIVHMEEVTMSTVTSAENPEFEETYYFFSGTCIECPEAGLLSVPESLLTIIEIPPKSYTVSFNANGGTGKMDDMTFNESAFAAPECTFTYENHTFLKWALGSLDGPQYAIGESIENVTTDIVLYALWTEDKLDPNAGTITDDQQEEIKELLPEETTVDEQRIEESIVAISEETAHEIITVINDAHEQNEAALAAGEITQEEYVEKKEIIQTVTEVAVVVGASATTATDEGKAVDNALPEDHDLGFTMDEALNEFYQTQMEYLLGKKKAPDKKDDSRIKFRDTNSSKTTYDITNVSKEDYAKMIGFVDTAVSNMKDAALHIRKCSSAKMKVVVKDYIQVVKISSFREFKAEEAEKKFVDAIYEAIMLNMQQQVIDSLERSHKPTNNPEKELLYQQQLEVCKNYDTFEQLVLEVLRQKYNAISNAPEVNADDFEDIYKAIFRSWALNRPEENPTSISLEQLTTATIETTKANANRFEFNTAIKGKETTVFIIFGAVALLGIASAIAVPILVKKTKQRGLN